MQISAGDVLSFTAVIGEKYINDFMASVGLKPDYKMYARAITLNGTVDGTVTDSLQVMQRLLTELQTEFYVAELKCNGRVINGELEGVAHSYSDPAIREVSDGTHIRFLHPAPREVVCDHSA